MAVQAGEISAILNAFGQLGQANAQKRQRDLIAQQQEEARQQNRLATIGALGGAVAGGFVSPTPGGVAGGAALGSQLGRGMGGGQVDAASMIGGGASIAQGMQYDQAQKQLEQQRVSERAALGGLRSQLPQIQTVQGDSGFYGANAAQAAMSPGEAATADILRSAQGATNPLQTAAQALAVKQAIQKPAEESVALSEGARLVGKQSGKVLAENPKANETYRWATPAEISKGGYQEGTAAQVDKDGKLHNIRTPQHSFGRMAVFDEYSQLALEQAKNPAGLSPEKTIKFDLLRGELQKAYPTGSVDPQSGLPQYAPGITLGKLDEYQTALRKQLQRSTQAELPANAESNLGATTEPLSPAKEATAIKKPLERTAQDAVMQRQAASNFIDVMQSNIHKTGIVKGKWSEVLSAVGLDPDAQDFQTAADSYRLGLRSTLRGQGQISDQEQVLLDNLTPKLGEPTTRVQAKLAYGRKAIELANAGELDYLRKTNFIVPKALEEAAEKAAQAQTENATLQNLKKKYPGLK